MGVHCNPLYNGQQEAVQDASQPAATWAEHLGDANAEHHGQEENQVGALSQQVSLHHQGMDRAAACTMLVQCEGSKLSSMQH